LVLVFWAFRQKIKLPQAPSTTTQWYRSSQLTFNLAHVTVYLLAIMEICENGTTVAVQIKSVFGHLLKALNGALDHYFWFSLLDFHHSGNQMQDVPSLRQQTSLSSDDYLRMLKECEFIHKKANAVNVVIKQWEHFLTINNITCFELKKSRFYGQRV
jgi:hypothetical protein